MKCEEARKYLYALLDNELDTERNLEVLSHLNVCDRCSRRFDREQVFLEKLSETVQSEEPDEAFRERMEQMVRERTTRRSILKRIFSFFRRRRMISSSLFLGGAVAILLGFFWFTTAGSSLQSNSVVQHMGEMHRGFTQQNQDQEADLAVRTSDPESLRRRFAPSFNLFRNHIVIPSLEDQRYTLLGGQTKNVSLPRSPLPGFVAVYRQTNGEEKRNYVSHQVLDLQNTSLDSAQFQSLREEILKSSDTFRVVDTGDVKMVLWGNENMLCSFVARDVKDETLRTWAKNAYRQSLQFFQERASRG